MIFLGVTARGCLSPPPAPPLPHPRWAWAGVVPSGHKGSTAPRAAVLRHLGRWLFALLPKWGPLRCSFAFSFTRGCGEL